MKKILLLLFVLVLAAGCGKNLVESELDIDSYPLSVGSWWQYEVFENLSDKYDTLTIQIVDSFPLRGYEGEYRHFGQLWVMTYSDHYDSAIAIVHLDKIWITIDEVVLNIEYPLGVSKKWSNDYDYDSTFVIDQSTVHTNYGPFQNSFFIESGRYTGPALHYYEAYKEYWLAPDAGLVKLYVRITDGLAITESYTWNLIDFNISR